MVGKYLLQDFSAVEAVTLNWEALSEVISLGIPLLAIKRRKASKNLYADLS